MYFFTLKHITCIFSSPLPLDSIPQKSRSSIPFYNSHQKEKEKCTILVNKQYINPLILSLHLLQEFSNLYTHLQMYVHLRINFPINFILQQILSTWVHPHSTPVHIFILCVKYSQQYPNAIYTRPSFTAGKDVQL